MLNTSEQPQRAANGKAEDPLRVCLLGYRSNPYSGGQGVYIRFLSKALLDAGHSVDVISGPPYPDIDHRVKLIKLPSLNLFEADNHVTALKLRHLLSYTDLFEWSSMLTGGFAEPYTFGRRLVEYFREHKPDYDIVHDNQSLCYGTLKLQKMGIPLITTIHHPITRDREIALQSAETWGLRLLIRRWHRFLGMQKKVVKQLDHIVTVSEASQGDISEAFGVDRQQIHTIHNGIDTDLFKPDPSVAATPDTVMTTTSADAPLKGLGYLLKAIAKLKSENRVVQLILLGKLKQGGKTEQMIKDLGIGGQIEFHSDISSKEVAALHHRASIAVVPSVYEGFGLPAGEAMASGLPVVSTDGGALPEIVGNAGIIVPAKDENALACAIRNLLDDPVTTKRLSRQARKRVVENFTWQLTAMKMVTLYRQIIRSMPGTRIA